MTTALDVSSDQESISSTLIEDVCGRLAGNKRIRQALPGGGMLHIDRMLPFLCVYRRDPARRDEGTERLLMSEASYLVAPGTATSRRGLRKLVRRIAETVSAKLDSFLIVEFWSGEDQIDSDQLTGEALLPRPAFRIFSKTAEQSEAAVTTLEFSLQEIRVHRKKAKVDVDADAMSHPRGLKALFTEEDRAKINCEVVGLEIRPIYRDPQSGEVYDRVIRSFGRDIGHALKKMFFAFAKNQTAVNPQHYFALGASRMPKQVFAIDRQLADLSRQFKFLLLVTPINAERAWNDFRERGFRKSPVFHYRPLDADPLLLKRRLMKIATERVEDPTLSYVLRQTQYELDRQITMLADLGTFRFLPGSLQVFGDVDPKLRTLAEGILKTLIEREPSNQKSTMLNAAAFARRAEKEIQFYRDQSPAFLAKATPRDDIYSGLMVSGGDLLIGRETRIAKHRADALLQHEVGTHLVTYYNGAVQPLRLLQVGLAGYDALQEGLAVLSEYLVGGLSSGRLRTLAARVIAVDQMVHGESFPNVFQHLVDEYQFETRTAYTITLRVFRGGGLTKDALYLQGLVKILEYLGEGGDLEPLLVGKIAAEHVPIICEFLFRGILRPPPLRPRYLDRPESLQRLAKIDSKTTVIDLIHDDTA